MVRFLVALLLLARVSFAATLTLPTVTIAANTTIAPGPDIDLFNHPYYSCVQNFYVATTGSDSNPGTQAAPWASLQHANDVGRQAGDCVNVAPGTYTKGARLTAGGNLAAATGYVVWRCQTLDACLVTDPGNNGSTTQHAAFAVEANYVMIDGFTIASSASPAMTYSNGIATSQNVNAFVLSAHHVWAINNVISGYGLAGVSLSQGDYGYVVHNKIFGNAIAPNCDSGAQGSGISIVIPIEATSYTPTTGDSSNPVVGNVGTAFRQFVEWNVLYNNHLTACGTNDTDGNNIILDTWNWNSVKGAAPYEGGGLVAFNVSYNAGGGGIHGIASDKVTVANNSLFNNGLDPTGQVTTFQIDNNSGNGWAYINNLAVSYPTAPTGGTCVQSAPRQPWTADIGGGSHGTVPETFLNNITQLRGGVGYHGTDCWQSENPMFNIDTGQYGASNKQATDPQWVDVGTTSIGTMTTPPVGTNFALKPTSPAIGYGLTEPYLNGQAIDVGACFHTLTTCP
jgi:hypothetical protein